MKSQSCTRNLATSRSSHISLRPKMTARMDTSPPMKMNRPLKCGNRFQWAQTIWRWLRKSRSLKILVSSFQSRKGRVILYPLSSTSMALKMNSSSKFTNRSSRKGYSRTPKWHSKMKWWTSNWWRSVSATRNFTTVRWCSLISRIRRELIKQCSNCIEIRRRRVSLLLTTSSRRFMSRSSPLAIGISSSFKMNSKVSKRKSQWKARSWWRSWAVDSTHQNLSFPASMNSSTVTNSKTDREHLYSSRVLVW